VRILYVAPGAIAHTIGATTNTQRIQPSTFKPNGASRPAPSFPQHPTPVTICQYRARTRAPRTSHLGRPSSTTFIEALTILITGHGHTDQLDRPTARREGDGRSAHSRARRPTLSGPLSDWPHWGPCGKLVESRAAGARGGGAGQRASGRRGPRARRAPARVVDCRIVRATNRITYYRSITNCSRQGQRSPENPQSTESTHGPTYWTLNLTSLTTRRETTQFRARGAQRGTPGVLSAAPTGPRACAHTRPLTHARFSSQCMHITARPHHSASRSSRAQRGANVVR
jgi:hypothetical protein